MTKFKIAIFASGNGSNAERVFKYFQHHPSIEVVLLLSNNPVAYALERANKFHIPVKVFNKQEFNSTQIVLEWLKEKQVTHVILAGFLWLIPDYLVKAFPFRMINIHPALLPKFGGKGLYGAKVHEAVKETGEKETGITIHEVNEKYDEGKILFQATCAIEPKDTPEQIAEKVHQLEYEYYAAVIENWITGKL